MRASDLTSNVPSASPRLDVSAADIVSAETRLLALPQVDCALTHRFADGICLREVKMPADSVIIGHAHRFADLNLMLTGRLTLLLEDGTLKELKAPLTFLGTPGRKIAFIHEDVVWQNVWPTKVGRAALPRGQAEQQLCPTDSEWMDMGTDVEAIEEYYLDKSPGWTADRAQRLAMERLARQPDRESFDAFLRDQGLPANDVRRISENQADQCPMPDQWMVGSMDGWKFQIGESAIEGKGVLATADIAAGEVIGPMRIDGKRTPLGRYTNHAAEPNAEVRLPSSILHPPSSDLVLVSLRAIPGCRGGQPGEEITIDYAQALAANAASVIQNTKTKGFQLCQP